MFVYELWCSQISFLVLIALDQDAVNEENEFQRKLNCMKIKEGCAVECCEKYKSFKLKIPQPDSERRHSPDFRTVFGIMIGPFSSCEIGKTCGTNKQENKQTNKN